MTDSEHHNPFLELAAKISVGFDGVKKAVEDQTNWNRLARSASAPVLYRNAFSGIVPSSGFLVIQPSLSGPDQGYIWYVRSIVIGGTAPGSSITGRADIFVSAADLRSYTSLVQIGMVDWRDQTATLPNVAFYGRGELPLRSEKLFIVVSSATSGQQIEGGVQIEGFQESAASQEWTM